MSKQIPEISDITVGLADEMYRIASATVMKSSASKNDDTTSVRVSDGAIGILVADGATGIGQGDLASGALKRFFEARYGLSPDGLSGSAFLAAAEDFVRESVRQERAEADTTAIVLTIREGHVSGASRGDSEAYVYGVENICLTQAQVKRPRLGNGYGRAVEFTSAFVPGNILIAATDGLWNRLTTETVGDIAKRSLGVDQTVAALLSLARTYDGNFDDDISIIAVARLR